jgi:glutaredoxin
MGRTALREGLPMKPIAVAGAALLALLLALPCQAQFKVVGPDGKVSYSDRPPAGAPAQPLAARTSGTPRAELPYEVRQVVARYPVTLYTTAKCTACDAARNWLRTRGVPFDEKTISNKDENELLARTLGNNELPALSIGTQALHGYSAEQWAAYFDAAGYPRASLLPRTYRYAAASPLIAPAPKAEEQTAPEVAPAPPPAGPTPENPAGIKF